MSQACWHRAFGLTWQADLPLALFRPVADPGRPPDVRVVRADRPLVRTGGVRVNQGRVFADGIRLDWDDVVRFDMVGGTHLFYTPGPGWCGALPGSFHGTVAALLLAWRGALPMHASAVAADGRAMLVAGNTGAGKSSLVAGLCADGMGLIGDDLCAVVRDADGRSRVPPGRSAVRLYPEAAALARLPVEGEPDNRGKRLARAPTVPDDRAVPIAAVLVLEDGPVGPVAVAERLGMLHRHLFRPRWMATLPGRARRHLDLLALSLTTPLFRLPPVDARQAAAFGQAVRHASDLLRGEGR